MPSPTSYHLSVESAKHTEEVGEKIGANLKGGEAILLRSDLGGGKTTLVRGLARGAGTQAHVSSPTFTLSKEYATERLTIHHYDLYRLQDPGILAHEITEVLTDPKAVVIVEWGDIVDDILPQNRLVIDIEKTSETQRRLVVTVPEDYAYVMGGVC